MAVVVNPGLDRSDLEKAYDRVPREELWYCMRKSGVAEKYVRVVQDMYVADDIVICSESREQVEENLERWRFVLERRGMKVSRSKTEYMCVNEREGSGTVRLQGEEVKKVQEFKYLGSTVQSNGECGKEVKKRVQAGWNGWRKVWGVLCERKISARIKGKVYRTVVRAAMLYGLETVSLRKRQESELEVAELKMLRFSLGVTRLDRIRNEYIRGTAHVGRLGDKVREARLRWFGHVQRRENAMIIISILVAAIVVVLVVPLLLWKCFFQKKAVKDRNNDHVYESVHDIAVTACESPNEPIYVLAGDPAIINQVQRVFLPKEHFLFLSCDGQSDVEWRHGERSLRNVNSTKQKLLSDGTLYISEVEARDSGLYYCNNQPMAHVTVLTGGTVYLQCSLPKQRWAFKPYTESKRVFISTRFKNGTVIKERPDPDSRFTHTPDHLQILNIQTLDSGTYYCSGKDIAVVSVTSESNTLQCPETGKNSLCKREEHRVTYKSGGRSTQVDYILCRRGNLKEISDCKVVVGESVARQHRMVVCRMTLMVCKTKRSKIEIEKKTKWWKLKKEECCEEFRQKLRQALGGQVVLPDDWETTAEVIRETGRKVLGVSSGRRKEDKETWWWNEEVQDSIQRKRLAKKKWDMDRTEENRQEYKELQRRVKREVSKAKQKAYDELYTRLDTREGEKDLYRLARQRDRDGKDVQQVRVIKDRDGRVLTSEESVQRRWKEYFEELMNEENEKEKRVEGVNSVEQEVDKIRKDEVKKALKRMKTGKAVGPDDIPVEVWKCLGEAAVEFLTSLFNRVLESERMPEEWRRSVLVPIFKNKGDVQSCSNYRGIKLMSHTMKLWERVVEARLRKVVEICEQQYGFMPRKSTTDAIFALRILMEKYRDGQRELHCVFVDLEKAYDRVPREELWYCMRKSGVAEKYVRVVQDMYERSRTVVRCAVGQTEEFKVEVGLHQGSALSPFLFAIVMDQLSEEVRQESPWTMMFADDIVICSESREQVEENLERWRFALERRGMKVSGSKTEYMCVNEREGSGTVRLQGEEVKKVQEFKYLGSTVQSNGECGKEVKKRVQAGWNGWRKVWGVLCDRKISARIKGKVYRTVVRPAMLYGLETVSLRKRQESELEVAELKMLSGAGRCPRSVCVSRGYSRPTLGDHVSKVQRQKEAQR
ncbi:hypothetical protein QTP86_009459 [Hemibagrus guttatus]|nr:hypothetical protein QTP86_009459 [Hemibagrus guttatus]